MHTIKLKINDNIYEKLILMLKKFDKSQLEIITDEMEFIEHQKYLESELEDLHSGNAQYIGFEELDTRLENLIKEIELINTKDRKLNNE